MRSSLKNNVVRPGARGENAPLAKICLEPRERIFFIGRQPIDASSKNGLLYDGVASGRSFYNWHRDYNPALGRYVQSDPIGLAAGSMSTYAYVSADPLSYADPFGLQSILQCANPVNAPACIEAGIIEAPKPIPIPVPLPVDRDIWPPDKNSGQWTCKARADCNDNIPGNCPQDPKQRVAFGGGTANDQGTARNIAKSNATSNLACQPKHVSCKCTGPKGEQYSGGC